MGSYVQKQSWPKEKKHINATPIQTCISVGIIVHGLELGKELAHLDKHAGVQKTLMCLQNLTPCQNTPTLSFCMVNGTSQLLQLSNFTTF